MNSKFSFKALPGVLSSRLKLFAFIVDLNWVTTGVHQVSNTTGWPSIQLIQRALLPLPKGRPSSSTMLTSLHVVATSLVITVESLLLVELFMCLCCKLSKVVCLWRAGRQLYAWPSGGLSCYPFSRFLEHAVQYFIVPDSFNNDKPTFA